MGIPTIPGPMTPILRTTQLRASRLSSLSGIFVCVGLDRCVDKLPVPQFQIQKSPDSSAKRQFSVYKFVHKGYVENSTGSAMTREQSIFDKFVSFAPGPKVKRDRETHFVLTAQDAFRDNVSNCAF